jgi:uncharacterized protein YbjT (DUF2867 family)
VGGTVARSLSDEGMPTRLVVRDAGRAPDLEDAPVVVAEYGDREASLAALEGVEVLLMVSAAENEHRLAQHRSFVDAARDAGVAHIVYTSFIGASQDCTFTLGRDHWATEEHIRRSGMQFTFLRDNFYADFMQYMVGEDDVLRGPAGEGRAALVARSDVAAVAAAVLRDPGAHAGASYDLTGPEAVSLTEVATILSGALDRPIRYHAETVSEAYLSRERYDAPEWQVDAWVSTYTSIAKGEMAGVSGDIERITGQAPLSLAEVMGA